jgi:hypothetical protein
MRFETEWADAAIHRTGSRDGSLSADLSGKSPFAVDRDPGRSEAGCVAKLDHQAESVRPSNKPHGNGSCITRLLSSAFSNLVKGLALYGAAMCPGSFLLADDRLHCSGLGRSRAGSSGQSIVFDSYDIDHGD